MSGENNFLRAQFFANMGDIYQTLKKHEASDSAYENALKYNPDNAYALNNYSYYLSLEKTKPHKSKANVGLFKQTRPRQWLL
jgi:Tfp pilus assembly protein PilF